MKSSNGLKRRSLPFANNNHNSENDEKNESTRFNQNIKKERRRIPSTKSTESTTAIDAFNGRCFPHEPKPRSSILSAKYNGFVNLCGTLLSFWALYTIYSNYKLNGKIVDLSLLYDMLSDFPTMVVLWLTTMLCTFLVVFLHWLRVNGVPETPVVLPIYIILQIALFVIPSHISIRRPMSPMLKAALSMQVCVLSMKMHSFYMTTRYILRYGIRTLKPSWQQQEQQEENIKNKHSDINNSTSNSKKSLINGKTSNPQKEDNKKIETEEEKEEEYGIYKGPEFDQHDLVGMTAGYAEFLCMPTLIWEPVFPRVPRIRYHYVLREWASAAAVWFIMYLIIQQHIAPSLEIAVQMNLIELILQLGVPTLMIWLLGFYSVFHCMLNGIAELSRFADREFYLDWWNSTSMTDYWRLWNRPVYKWMCRHIYVESMRQVPFFNKWLASMGTFVVTAVLHEYVMANTFHIQKPLLYRPWLGVIILTQIPFLYFTEIQIIKETRWGNLLMWIGFVFGMPMIELLYIRDYVVAQHTP